MPLAKSWLDWEEAAGGRATLKGTPEEIKGMYDQLVQALMPMFPPPNENVNVVEGDVDGIKYRTYTPKGIELCHKLVIAVYADQRSKRATDLSRLPSGHTEGAI